MSAPLWLRRVVRPLIPDALMALLRLREHSRQVRTNVDVVAEGRAAQARWLLTTPDTYRVRSRETFGPPPRTFPVAVHAGQGPVHLAIDGLGSDEFEDLRRPLADPSIDAVVLGAVEPPRLVGGRRTEPDIDPRAIAVRSDLWSAVGGAPPGPRPLPGLLDRLRDAGAWFTLVPSDRPGQGVRRTDPITLPAAVVLAVVPIHDVGGGSRGAQMTLELLRRGYHVTYVAMFGTAESEDLGLRYVHPHLEQVRADRFEARQLAERIRGEERIAIAELPATGYVDTFAELGRSGFRLVYDVIDDWTSPALGGRWYRPDIEERFVELADATAASAPALVRHAASRGAADPVLVPNAVNQEVFGSPPGPRPPDLPEPTGPILGYHGSLYGDWFDWDAVARVASRWPQGAVVLIGDPPDPLPDLPPNVVCLGLRAHGELPAYVARFHVGLVPFVVSPVTHAVSPLKVFEYLALGVPVASTPLEPLQGLDGVRTAPDLVEAVRDALAAPRPDRAAALRAHSWGARLEALFGAVGAPLGPPWGAAPDVRVRPVVHHSRRDRRVPVH